MNEKNDKELNETIEAIERAQKKLEQLSNDEHERELADLRDKYIRDQYSVEQYGYEHGKIVGIEEGRASGIRTGSKQKQLEIAKAMLDEGFDIQTISKITKLTKEEILNLN